jgi:integrase
LDGNAKTSRVRYSEIPLKAILIGLGTKRGRFAHVARDLQKNEMSHAKARINERTRKPLSPKMQECDAIQKVIYERPGGTVPEIHNRVSYRMLFNFLADAGTRIGEARWLTWEDVALVDQE